MPGSSTPLREPLAPSHGPQQETAVRVEGIFMRGQEWCEGGGWRGEDGGEDGGVRMKWTLWREHL